MTQHYVGTKIVEAWKQEKDGQPGYAVKYSDGYISWSPQAQFEAAYLAIGHIGNLPGHIQRMVAEHAELADRILKLDAFTKTETFLALPELERTDLFQQLALMSQYQTVLKARLERAQAQ